MAQGLYAAPIVETPSAWSDFTDSWTDDGFYQAAVRAVSGVSTAWDEGFDPQRQAEVDGVGQDWRYFSDARNREHYDWLKGRLQQERDRDARAAVSDRWVVPMLGAMLSPTGLAGALFIPGSIGLGMARSALRVGASNLALEAGSEAMRRAEHPYPDMGDSIMRVGVATAFAGAMGGVAGLAARGRVNRVAEQFALEYAAQGGIADEAISRAVHGADGVSRSIEIDPPNLRGRPDEAAAMTAPVRTDAVTGNLRLSPEAVTDSFARKGWRDLGLSDDMFPTANHWQEWLVRYEAERSALDGPPVDARGIDWGEATTGLRSLLDSRGLSDVRLVVGGRSWDEAVSLGKVRGDALAATLSIESGPVTIMFNPKAFEGADFRSMGLGDMSPRGVARHEMVHALRRLGVLNDAEWSKLLREADKRLDPSFRSEILGRYKGKSDASLEEEIVAELFRLSETDNAVARTAMQRIRNFMQSLYEWIMGQGFGSADDLLRAIEAGEVGARPRRAADAPAQMMLPPTSSLRRALEGKPPSKAWADLASWFDPARMRRPRPPMYAREASRLDLVTESRLQETYAGGNFVRAADPVDPVRPDERVAGLGLDAAKRVLEESPAGRLVKQSFQDNPLSEIPLDVVKMLSDLGVLRQQDVVALNRLTRGRERRVPGEVGEPRAMGTGEITRDGYRALSNGLNAFTDERVLRLAMQRGENSLLGKGLAAADRVTRFYDMLFAEMQAVGARSYDEVLEGAARGRLARRMLQGGTMRVDRDSLVQLASRVERMVAGNDTGIPDTATRPAPKERLSLGESEAVRRRATKAVVDARETESLRAIYEARMEMLREVMHRRLHGEISRPQFRADVELSAREFDETVQAQLRDYDRWNADKLAKETALARKPRSKPRIARPMWLGRRDPDYEAPNTEPLFDSLEARTPIVNGQPGIERGLLPDAAEMRMPTREDAAKARAMSGYDEWRKRNNGKLREVMADGIERLAESPYKRVLRTAKTDAVRGLMLDLSDDGGFNQMAAAMGERRGPSIWMAQQQWSKGLPNDLYQFETEAYEAYLGHPTNPRLFGIPLRKSFGDLPGMTMANGKTPMKLQEFTRQAFIAHATGIRATSETAGEAAEHINTYADAIGRFYEKFRVAAEETGVLSPLDSPERVELMKHRVRADKTEAEQALAGLGEPPVAGGNFIQRLHRQQHIERMEALQARVRAADEEMASLDSIDGRITGDDQARYATRIFSAHVWRKYPDEIKAKLRDFIASDRMRRGAQDDAVIDGGSSDFWDGVNGTVEDIYRHVTEGRADTDVYGRLGGVPNFARERPLRGLRNADLVNVRTKDGSTVDFIETDPMTVANAYAQRMGPNIEFSRRFKGNEVHARIGFERAVDNAMYEEALAYVSGLGKDASAMRRFLDGFLVARDKSILNRQGEVVKFVNGSRNPTAVVVAEGEGGMRKLFDAEKTFMLRMAIESEDNLRAFSDHMAALERDLRIDKDRVLHRAVPEPDRWDNRWASILKDHTHLAVLGLAGLSSIPDAAKIMFEHGLSSTVSGAFRFMDPNTAAIARLSVGEAEKAGAMFDVVQSAVARLADVGTDPIHMTGYEKWLRRTTNKFFMWNGLGPLTYGLKSIDAVIRVDELIDDAIAIRDGTATTEQLGRAQRYGMTPARAKAFAAQVDNGAATRDPTGRFWIANTDGWNDATAVRDFRSMLAQGINNTILTASLADRPAMFDGVLHFRKGKPELDARARKQGWQDVGGYWRVQSGLASFPFVYWTFGMAAMNKITVPALRHANARMMGGVVAQIGLGYIALNLRMAATGGAGLYAWNNMDFEDRLARVIDQAGVAGQLMDWTYTAQSLVGGATGANPLAPLGFSYRYGRDVSAGEAALDMLGAPVGVMSQVPIGAGMMLSGQEGGLDTMSRGMPGRNLVPVRFWYDNIIQSLED